MIRSLQIFSGLIISLALITPLSHASSRWYVSAFILCIMLVIYCINFFVDKKVVMAMITAMISGLFLSLAFWALYYLECAFSFQHSFHFTGSFFLFALLTAILIIFTNRYPVKKTLFLIINILATAALILIITHTINIQSITAKALVLGTVIGLIFGSICGSIFKYIYEAESSILNSFSDYISILSKPFAVFFMGYISIALVYAGIYDYIYTHNPAALSIPAGQIKFLDLIFYALDTMTTGGNSAVNAETLLTQGINTANVLTAIIWMTVMLAATIAYTSEEFYEIYKKHRKHKMRPTDD